MGSSEFPFVALVSALALFLGIWKAPSAELERLGVFRDFIEGLDLDDFDKPKK